jgi:hypothetical protein
MSRFENTETGVVVVVADDKDDRFASALWKSAAEAKPASKRSSSNDK